MYNEFQTLTTEYDECLSKGICSVNPTLTALQEIILLYLRELSFYLIKLRGCGVTNEKAKELIMDALFNIIANTEYDQQHFQSVISKLYDYISQSKILYRKVCGEKNIDVESLKSYFKYSKKFDLTDAIRKGEKYYLKKTQSLTQRQKDLHDILLFLAKSISIKIIELEKLNKQHEEAYYTVLSILNTTNPIEFNEEKVKKEINDVIQIYYDVAKEVFKVQNELYGEMEPTEVSLTTHQGKAILVSGTDFSRLEQILNATRNTKIDIYTHGMEMLMAHAFPKFRSYPNLKGHYGMGLETALIDFASFPGAILMTKFNLQKVEYLYRGRLFTVDPIAPVGIIKIRENDYEPLIKSALDAKGFSHTEEKLPIKVGFSEKLLDEKINEVAEKIQTNKIKNLYIIGLLNYRNDYKSYFEKFFELMPDDSFAFSLSFNVKKPNVFHIDSFFDYTLIYKTLRKINEKIPLNQINMNIFITRCDKHTISNLLYLKHMGVKNVYTCKCPPTLITPSLMQTLKDSFGIKELTDAKKDLEETLQN